ncbi:hypothetical protein Ataiwa_04660 [Algoriphagus taiwanensis]|uniref:Uncharacterized protein n=1 Tax=Algoriphagus taiwanensis TaxID=1445656 RepID=A0ABQ6PW47_9BACT|nr:hypothetical protein Ataiwa_04660 [Algoriphagus taiwanensis]
MALGATRGIEMRAFFREFNPEGVEFILKTLDQIQSHALEAVE